MTRMSRKGREKIQQWLREAGKSMILGVHVRNFTAVPITSPNECRQRNRVSFKCLSRILTSWLNEN